MLSQAYVPCKSGGGWSRTRGILVSVGSTPNPGWDLSDPRPYGKPHSSRRRAIGLQPLLLGGG